MDAAPGVGVSPPTSLDIADVIKTTARLFGKMLLPGMVVATIFNLPGQLVGLGLQLFMASLDPKAFAEQMRDVQPEQLYGIAFGLSLAYLAVIFFTVVFQLIATGAITHMTLGVMNGGAPSIGASLMAALRKLPWLFLAAVLIGFAAIAGMFALCIGYFVVLIFTCVAAQAVMGEDMGPVAAIRRSVELVRPHWAMVIVLLLIFAAVIFGMSMVAGVVTIPVSLLMKGDNGQVSALGTVINWFVGLVVGMPAFLASSIGSTVLYARLRGMKEGVNVAEMAGVFS